MADAAEPIGGLIIHLERATGRAAHVASLLNALPVEAEVLSAIDARAEDAEGGETWRHDPALGLSPRYPFPLSETEVAVFLSHRRAWARIVAAGWRAGLVLEDDVTLDPVAFPAAYGLAAKVLNEDRFVRLPMKDRENAGETVSERAGVRAVRPSVVGLNLQASLVGRGAAQQLLAASERFDRPVDSWLQMTWDHGVDILSIWPSGVGEISGDLGGSTQKKRKGITARLRAEVARGRYRAAIARMSAGSRTKG